ncbi:acetate--CoA ligase family protein [Conexibacter sp. CPCC 206217]|uniref:acetate--CoA ligase family protein n=1 Tax=Conexibacter sp. CPCC 206217 TaxID=3064574 RepID=UPI00271B3127|nr:acetate--CoA ligase family protein [Conexibacter sp. CPCC 206217]MDO8210179.1 acetate--CoA ligase family protein [Conexibacter sp. CPCC 206217]
MVRDEVVDELTPVAARALLAPRSVAVVGASERTDALGTVVVENLRAFGFDGSLYPVNPRYREVCGLACHPSLADLPEVPDCAFLAVPASAGPELIEQAAALGVSAAFVNGGGYADAGAEGAALQRRVVDAARAAGMAVCGPNNLGLISYRSHAALWAAPLPPAAVEGRTAIVTHSGSSSLALAQALGPRGLSHVITAGNEAVLGLGHYLDAVLDDGDVDLVVLFIETIRDPRHVARSLARASELGVPVVALKVGRSQRGTAMVAAHTGALAGDAAACDAFLDRWGVAQARDVDELIALATLFKRFPAGPRRPSAVGMTLSGGQAGLLADLGEAAALDLPQFSERTEAALTPIVSAVTSLNNPLDVFGLGFDLDGFSGIVDALVADPEIGTVAAFFDMPPTMQIDNDFARGVVATFADTARRTDAALVLVNNVAGSGLDESVLALERAGTAVLNGMAPAVAALATWARGRRSVAPAETARRDLAGVERLWSATDAERFAVLAQAGLAVPAMATATTPEAAAAAAARIGFPVVLKGTAPTLLHKTELDAVALGLDSHDAVLEAGQEILRRVAGHEGAGLVVQRMVGPAVELIVGARVDPVFGVLLVVGAGGVLVELAAEVAVRLGPVGPELAEEMLRETAAWKLLQGVRGAPRADVAAAVAAVVGFSRLAVAAQGRISAMEINPLMVLPQGQGAVAVDIVVERATEIESGENR